MPKLKKKNSKKSSDRVRIVTPIGRIIYPYLLTKDVGRQNSSNKYSVQLLIPKKEWKKEGADIRDCILRVGQKYFEDKSLDLEDFANPIHDGDDKAATGEFYAGQIYLVAKSDYQPAVIDGKKKDLKEDRVRRIKSGDYARLVCTIYPYEQGGVTMGLEVVQFVREGEAITGGRAQSIEMLDEMEIEDDEDLEDPMEEDEDEEEEAPKTKKAKVKPKPKPRKQNKKKVEEEDEEDEEEAEDEDEEEEEAEEKPKRGRPKASKANGKAKVKANELEDEDEEEEEDEDEDSDEVDDGIVV